MPEGGVALCGCVEVVGSCIKDAAGTPSATAIWCSRWTEIPVLPFSMALIVAGLTLARSDSLRIETLRANLPVFGYQDQAGHCEIVFRNVRVPTNPSATGPP